MTAANVLGIFAKQPIAGKVKTRLGTEIGHEQAASLYESFLQTLQKRLRGEGDSRCFCYAPQTTRAQTYFENLADEQFKICPQSEGELGVRLQTFFDEQFDAGAQKIVVIGSDSPTLPTQIIQEAFEKLDHHDCVLGPAADGGYYLVGMRKKTVPIFDDINWSTANVLFQTVQKLKRTDSRFCVLDKIWYDVDNLEGLHLLRGHLAGMNQLPSNELSVLSEVVNRLLSERDS